MPGQYDLRSPLANSASPVSTGDALSASMAAPDPNALTPIQREQSETGGNEAERGLRSSVLGISAGSAAYSALSAQAQGTPDPVAEARANALSQESLAMAPRVSSLHQVQGIGDLVDWTMGQMGQMAPILAPAIAGGILGKAIGGAGSATSLLRAIPGFGKVGAQIGETVGAAMPFYPLSRNAAVLNQNQDPAMAAQPPEARVQEAQQEGLTGLVAGIAPSMIASRLTGGAVKTGLLADTAKITGINAATMAGQEAAAQHFRTALAPDRDTSHDDQALIDAAASGAVGVLPFAGVGALAGKAFHGVNVASEAVKAAPEAARSAVSGLDLSDAGDFKDQAISLVNSLLSKAPGAIKAAKTQITALSTKVGEAAPGWIKSLQDIADAVTPSSKDTAADWASKLEGSPDTPFPADDATTAGRDSAAFKSPFADVSDIDALRQRRTELNDLGTKYAAQMTADPNVPDAAKTWAQNVVSNGAQPGDYNRLAGYIDAANPPTIKPYMIPSVIAAAKVAGKVAIDALAAAKDKLSNSSDTTTPPKFSKIEPDGHQDLESYVFKNLKPEFQNDPQAVQAAKSTAYTVARLMGFGDEPVPKNVAQVVYHMLDDVVADKASFISGLPGDLSKVFDRIPERVVSDTDVGSGTVFDKFVDPSYTPGQRLEVATRLEQFMNGSVPDKYSKDAIGAFSQAFGGEAKFRAVLDHYGSRYESKGKALGGGDVENEALDAKNSTVDGEAPDNQLTTKDEPNAQYHFAEPGKVKGFESPDAAQAAIPELQARPELSGREFSIHPLGEYADQMGSTNTHFSALTKQLHREAGEHLGHPDEPMQGQGEGVTRGMQGEAMRGALSDVGSRYENGKVINDATPEQQKGFLNQFSVIKSAGEKTPLVASDKDLVNMRQRVGQGDPAGNFSVIMANGKKLALNAEGAIAHMFRTKGQDPEFDRSDGGESKGRMLKEAIASVLARSDVKGLADNALRPGLVLDRKSGLKLGDLKGGDDKIGEAIANEPGLKNLDKRIANDRETANTGFDSDGARVSKGDIVARYKDERSGVDGQMNGDLSSTARRIGEEHISRIDKFLDELSPRSDGDGEHEGVTDINNLPVGEEKHTYEEDGKAIGQDAHKLTPAVGATAAKVDTFAAKVRTGDEAFVGKSVDKIAKSDNVGTMVATRDVLAKHIEAASGAVKEKLMRVDGALKQRITDVISEAAAEPHSEVKPEIGAKESTPEARQAAMDAFHKTVGPGIKLAFEKTFDWSGKWDDRADTATISTLASDPSSVAHHESLHALMSKLTDQSSRTKLFGSLDRMASNGQTIRQLETLLKDHPEALEQVRTDRAERMAYMYQFNRAGLLKLGPESTNIFGKIADFVRRITGTVSKYVQAQKYMDAIYDGKFSDPSAAAHVIEDMHNELFTQRVRRLMGPVGEAVHRLMASSLERLNETQLPSLRKLADLIHRDPNNEQGNTLGFVQARARQSGIFDNQAWNVLKDLGNEEGIKLVRDMRSGEYTSPKAQELKGLLNKVFTYMQDAGTRRAVTDAEGKITGWEPLKARKDYGLPQIWNRDSILRDSPGFTKKMVELGIDPKDAEALVKKVVTPKDHDAVSQANIGLTPFNRSINGREFNFTPEQLKGLEPYLVNDPVNLMTTYIAQATHRAEYSRSFGYDGGVIKRLMAGAEEEGATPDELTMAQKTMKGIDGTLGSDMNPKLRKLSAGAVVYENLALLPFALFSSLIDPLGITIRSGKFADARTAMVAGLKGLFSDIPGSKEDETHELSRTLGMISDANMLEKFGDVRNGLYMAKWLKNVNEKFFKLNGMSSWNRSMRTAAMMAGQRFILRHATNPEEHSERYLRELGITKEDVKPDGQGGIDTSSMPIQHALFKFVDDAVLRPNPAHRPIWGNDPHYGIIFHLKQYTYSYANVFVNRAHHEAEYGNFTPLYAMAAAVPFMDFVDTAQDLLFGGTVQHAGAGLLHALSRSGVLGTKNFGLDAAIDPSYGGVPGQSFLGPAINHGLYAAGTLAHQSGHTASGLLYRSIPAGGLVRGVT